VPDPASSADAEGVIAMDKAVGDNGAAPQRTRRPRRRRTPSADVEPELIAAAALVLARESVTGLTVRAVAEQARVAQTSVYNRFGGKDGLVEAVMIRALDQLTVLHDSGAEPSGPERLIGLGLRYRQWGLANPSLYALLFENPTAYTASDEVQEHARASMAAMTRVAELAAADLAVAGRPFVALSPYEVAQRFWWAMHGAVSLELNSMIFTASPAASYRSFLEAVLRGLADAVR
jgi:AcrR family transcriptional regulator